MAQDSLYGDYAPEFTGKLGQSFLLGQLAPLEEGFQAEEANAYREGEEGGLIGKFQTGAKIGAARAQRDIAKSSIIGQFNMNAANAAREERLTKQGQEFQASEAQKQRDFQQQIARMGFQFEDQQREARRKSENTITSSDILGLAGGAAAPAASALLTQGAEAAGPMIGEGLSALGSFLF